MNWLRYALISGIALVCYLLFLQWNAFDEQRLSEKQLNEANAATLSHSEFTAQSLAEESSLPQVSENSDDLPTVVNNDIVETAAALPETTSTPSLIQVQTDSVKMYIDSFGGDIVRVELLKHLASRDNKDSGFILMNRSAESTYVAQSGLLGPNGTDKSSSERPLFTSAQSNYVMNDTDDNLVVELNTQQDGVNITKRFRFERESYLVNIDYIIENRSNTLWRAAPYGQIRRSDFDVESDVGIGMQPYLGAAITTNDKNYDKIDFDDIADETIKVEKTGGWVSMVQHYFISAWVPNQSASNAYTLRKSRGQNLYILEYLGPMTQVAPNTQATIESAFYAGPKNLRKLQEISPYLELTLDYSWLSFIAKPLFLTLEFIHGFVGNWGVAIILLTLLIKIVFFYPSAISYRSMAKMRKLQPMMADLKERFGDDRQKMSGELMKIYRKEKINPLSGCLPILMQMPVFIALYWVLMESVELRHAPFALWIEDLSVKDPIFILPLIMGATMWIQQKLNPTPPDPMQAKVMQWMPVFFTALFLMFPAGLVLYWVVNNTLSIAQQYVITRQIEKGNAA